MLDVDKLTAIDFQTHAADPCGLHADAVIFDYLIEVRLSSSQLYAASRIQ